MTRVLPALAVAILATGAAMGAGPAQTGHESDASERPVLEVHALDKITGRAKVLFLPLNQTIRYATLAMTARSCYSTPASETPETSAFLVIEDRRADRPPRQVFSGWMYASSPGLNGMEHPLYDVWVVKCMTKVPAKAPPVKTVAPVSPNVGADEKMPELPEDAGQ
jgi:hypothetical protein